MLRVADQAAALCGDTARVLIITAAWTGARWGELAGLQRRNLHLDDARLVIDADTGALHESGRRLWLGPPKSAASARAITLPPFLVDLLDRHLASHGHELVFPSPDGGLLRRSNFIRRALRPAVNGNQQIVSPRVRTVSIKPGLTFHGLRHSHKTWMIADAIPEIAQARRLGHHLDNRLVECYSHVAAEVERRLLRRLQRRWTTANQHIHGAASTGAPVRRLRPA